MSRVLVIGYGSIGRRHARLMTEMGLETSVVTRQRSATGSFYTDVATALTAVRPDYIIIANETARHSETIELLTELGYRNRLLVEKPLTDNGHAASTDTFSRFAVAYNLRFHPMITMLRARIENSEVLAVDLRAGQHLSEWRPDRDYRQTYSASRDTGGGVLRDLSHELDLLLWIFGPWQRVAALGGNLGVLDINADEHWSALVALVRVPIAHIRLSYLDRPARREIVVTTREATFTADLMNGTLGVDGTMQQFNNDRDESYIAMHRAMIEDVNNDTLCTAEQGVEVGSLIAALELAETTGRWVAA